MSNRHISSDIADLRIADKEVREAQQLVLEQIEMGTQKLKWLFYAAHENS